MTKPIVVVGSINLDLVFRTARVPRAGETVMGSQFDIFPGGKGANQAVAVARLGHPVHFVGKVGNDAFSSQLLEALGSAGVKTGTVGRQEGSSGVALVVTTDSGQNSIVVYPGANSHLGPTDIRLHQHLIAGAGVVLTQLETPLETLDALSELTAAKRVPLILDPAPARKLPPEILKKVTWITPNETEAQFYAGVDAIGASDSELKKIAQCFLDLGPQNVLLKLGERGAFLATRKGSTRRIHAHKVDVKDTTAAGDAYNGAFAAALLRDSSPEEAAEFAAAAAAICVTRHGAQPSMPSQHEVEILMGQQPVTMLQSMAAAIPWDGQ